MSNEFRVIYPDAVAWLRAECGNGFSETAKICPWLNGTFKGVRFDNAKRLKEIAMALLKDRHCDDILEWAYLNKNDKFLSLRYRHHESMFPWLVALLALILFADEESRADHKKLHKEHEEERARLNKIAKLADELSAAIDASEVFVCDDYHRIDRYISHDGLEYLRDEPETTMDILNRVASDAMKYASYSGVRWVRKSRGATDRRLAFVRALAYGPDLNLGNPDAMECFTSRPTNDVISKIVFAVMGEPMDGKGVATDLLDFHPEK